MRWILLLALTVSSTLLHAQSVAFPDLCIGEWQGTMIVYQNGIARDTIPCEMTINSAGSDSIWTWKTVYKGDPVITKDYRMILPDSNSNYYILDEGEGLELRSYAVGNALFSNFAVQGSLLTSRYVLEGDELIFEITSGRIRDTTANDIINYSVPILQRSVLERVKE